MTQIMILGSAVGETVVISAVMEMKGETSFGSGSLNTRRTRLIRPLFIISQDGQLSLELSLVIVLKLHLAGVGFCPFAIFNLSTRGRV